MKLSKIIEAVKEDIEIYGDVEARHYKYTHLFATSESWMYSPTRKDRNGRRVRMNQKELKEFVEKNTRPLHE
jgi:hypothetical protein